MKSLLDVSTYAFGQTDPCYVQLLSLLRREVREMIIMAGLGRQGYSQYTVEGRGALS